MKNPQSKVIIDMQKRSILDQSSNMIVDSDREAENVVSDAFKKSKLIDETNSLTVTEDNELKYEEESFIKDEDVMGSKKHSSI